MAKKKESLAGILTEVNSPTKSAPKKIIIYVGVLVATILIVGSILYFLNLNKTGTQASEVPELVLKIGRIVELPANETPTLATVSDKSKLAGQAFFLNAENGDKVLIYEKSGKAILFRPATNKIINMSSINAPVSNQNTPSSSPSAETTVSNSPTQTPTSVKTLILNGTKKSGLAKTASSRLAQAGINIEATTGNASEDYDETIIVDITGQNKSLITKIAASLGGKISSLPQGEDQPSDADILIILGQDYVQ